MLPCRSDIKRVLRSKITSLLQFVGRWWIFQRRPQQVRSCASSSILSWLACSSNGPPVGYRALGSCFRTGSECRGATSASALEGSRSEMMCTGSLVTSALPSPSRSSVFLSFLVYFSGTSSCSYGLFALSCAIVSAILGCSPRVRITCFIAPWSCSALRSWSTPCQMCFEA